MNAIPFGTLSKSLNLQKPGPGHTRMSCPAPTFLASPDAAGAREANYLSRMSFLDSSKSPATIREK
jgi:hypothetical protein